MLHVSCMYPACLLHIRYVDLWMHLRYMYLMMYFRCIPHVSWSPLQIHVSRFRGSCQCVGSLVSYKFSLSRLYMYLECISHVSCISVTYLTGYIRGMRFRLYPACIPSKIYMYRDFVSRCILIYRDEESKIRVSWCILTCIQCDTKEAPKIHVS